MYTCMYVRMYVCNLLVTSPLVFELSGFFPLASLLSLRSLYSYGDKVCMYVCMYVCTVCMAVVDMLHVCICTLLACCISTISNAHTRFSGQETDKSHMRSMLSNTRSEHVHECMYACMYVLYVCIYTYIERLSYAYYYTCST